MVFFVVLGYSRKTRPVPQGFGDRAGLYWEGVSRKGKVTWMIALLTAMRQGQVRTGDEVIWEVATAGRLGHATIHVNS